MSGFPQNYHEVLEYKEKKQALHPKDPDAINEALRITSGDFPVNATSWITSPVGKVLVGPENHIEHALDNDTEQVAFCRFPLHFLPEKYCEMKIIALPSGAVVAIGLQKSAPTEPGQFPGWQEGTCGYHSDDGAMFNNNGNCPIHASGPAFGLGDIVGCGIDHEGNLFFTHNSVAIPTGILLDQPELYHPVVGFDHQGCIVTVNMAAKSPCQPLSLYDSLIKRFQPREFPNEEPHWIYQETKFTASDGVIQRLSDPPPPVDPDHMSAEPKVTTATAIWSVPLIKMQTTYVEFTITKDFTYYDALGLVPLNYPFQPIRSNPHLHGVFGGTFTMNATPRPAESQYDPWKAPPQGTLDQARTNLLVDYDISTGPQCFKSGDKVGFGLFENGDIFCCINGLIVQLAKYPDEMPLLYPAITIQQPSTIGFQPNAPSPSKKEPYRQGPRTLQRIKTWDIISPTLGIVDYTNAAQQNCLFLNISLDQLTIIRRIFSHLGIFRHEARALLATCKSLHQTFSPLFQWINYHQERKELIGLYIQNKPQYERRVWSPWFSHCFEIREDGTFSAMQRRSDIEKPDSTNTQIEGIWAIKYYAERKSIVIHFGTEEGLFYWRNPLPKKLPGKVGFEQFTEAWTDDKFMRPVTVMLRCGVPPEQQIEVQHCCSHIVQELLNRAWTPEFETLGEEQKQKIVDLIAERCEQPPGMTDQEIQIEIAKEIAQIRFSQPLGQPTIVY